MSVVDHEDARALLGGARRVRTRVRGFAPNLPDVGLPSARPGSLGPIGGGTVRLGAVRSDTWLCIAEGIETALAVTAACGMQRGPGSRSAASCARAAA